MDDAALVYHLKTRGHLFQHPQGEVELSIAVRKVVQGLAADKLHDKKRNSGRGDIDVDNGDQVGMVDTSEELGLAYKAGHRRPVCLTRKHLGGQATAIGNAFYFKHLAALALADAAHDAIVLAQNLI